VKIYSFSLILLVVCSITRFRNRVRGCNYPGTRTRFQIPCDL